MLTSYLSLLKRSGVSCSAAADDGYLYESFGLPFRNRIRIERVRNTHNTRSGGSLASDPVLRVANGRNPLLEGQRPVIRVSDQASH